MATGYMFLKLEGIEGEAQDPDYAKHIEILSWGLGADAAGSFATGSGGSVGKATLRPMTFTHYLDRASPNLFQQCLTNKHIASAKLSVLKLSNEQKLEYLSIELTHALVTSVSLAGHAGDNNLPTENFTLDFVKISMNYQPQENTGDPGGNIGFEYNIQQQK